MSETGSRMYDWKTGTEVDLETKIMRKALVRETESARMRLNCKE